MVSGGWCRAASFSQLKSHRWLLREVLDQIELGDDPLYMTIVIYDQSHLSTFEDVR
jgi:hypothetical protein